AATLDLDFPQVPKSRRALRPLVRSVLEPGVYMGVLTGHEERRRRDAAPYRERLFDPVRIRIHGLVPGVAPQPDLSGRDLVRPVTGEKLRLRFGEARVVAL